MHHPSPSIPFFESGINQKSASSIGRQLFNWMTTVLPKKKSTSVQKDCSAVLSLNARDNNWWVRSKIWRCKYPSFIVSTSPSVYSIHLRKFLTPANKVSSALIAIRFSSGALCKPQEVCWDWNSWMAEKYSQTELYINTIGSWKLSSLL